MCDILHIRHLKPWYRIEALFNLLGLKKEQERLLSIIHGLTGSVSKFFTKSKYIIIKISFLLGFN